jgi:ketosteroid isomerase-like protein
VPYGGLLGLTVLSACAQNRPVLDAEAVSAAADSATRSFQAAERARDPAAAIRHLAPDFDMLVDGRRIPYDSVVASVRRTLPALTSFATEWRDLHVRVLGPDAALVSFVFHDTVVTTEGDTARFTGPTTLVWQRRGADWLLVFADADHYPPDD